MIMVFAPGGIVTLRSRIAELRDDPPRTSYHGYRFPPDIIAHAVWLYFRFSLSFRDVEDLWAQRSIIVTYETIRQWCLTFGLAYTRTVRRRRDNRVIRGISTSSSSPSTAANSISGARWTRTATCSTS